jgi:hypothetical protein
MDKLLRGNWGNRWLAIRMDVYIHESEPGTSWACKCSSPPAYIIVLWINQTQLRDLIPTGSSKTNPGISCQLHIHETHVHMNEEGFTIVKGFWLNAKESNLSVVTILDSPLLISSCSTCFYSSYSPYTCSRHTSSHHTCSCHTRSHQLAIISDLSTIVTVITSDGNESGGNDRSRTTEVKATEE